MIRFYSLLSTKNRKIGQPYTFYEHLQGIENHAKNVESFQKLGCFDFTYMKDSVEICKYIYSCVLFLHLP